MACSSRHWEKSRGQYDTHALSYLHFYRILDFHVCLKGSFYWSWKIIVFLLHLTYQLITGCKGQGYLFLPGAISAIIGSDSDVTKKLPLGFLTARLCKTHADKTYAQFKLSASVTTPSVFLQKCCSSAQHTNESNTFTPLFFTSSAWHMVCSLHKQCSCQSRRKVNVCAVHVSLYPV